MYTVSQDQERTQEIPFVPVRTVITADINHLSNVIAGDSVVLVEANEYVIAVATAANNRHIWIGAQKYLRRTGCPSPLSSARNHIVALNSRTLTQVQETASRNARALCWYTMEPDTPNEDEIILMDRIEDCTISLISLASGGYVVRSEFIGRAESDLMDDYDEAVAEYQIRVDEERSIADGMCRLGDEPGWSIWAHVR